MEKNADLPTNNLIVPLLAGGEDPDIGIVSGLLQGGETHTLEHAPWHETYPAMPSVQFSIAHNKNSIYLQFTVEEEHIQAAHGRINYPVYQDSCVEFFISLDGGETYYNFEFNCIGTVLAGYGSSKHNRTLLPEEKLKHIVCQSIIRRGDRQSLVSWQLTVVIPFLLFDSHPANSWNGETVRANFYKCGDHLPQPHFLCWSPVQSEEPDFHLPQFFGTLVFDR